ncbi:uncharacterized protein LOC127006826 [Eriocheir sinensis]|uniref:uncharacterized protein LOC127006826 n=1 Tax=Eriocheir sinensis TaxID=95602 RepID=UPI0021C6B82B|nr:uncharacterized protein LOC127006826 [Eriocheir sinensis]
MPPLPEVWTPPGDLQQEPDMRCMQWAARHPEMPHPLQSQGGCDAPLPKLWRPPPCLESFLSSKTVTHPPWQGTPGQLGKGAADYYCIPSTSRHFCVGTTAVLKSPITTTSNPGRLPPTTDCNDSDAYATSAASKTTHTIDTHSSNTVCHSTPASSTSGAPVHNSRPQRVWEATGPGSSHQHCPTLRERCGSGRPGKGHGEDGDEHNGDANLQALSTVPEAITCPGNESPHRVILPSTHLQDTSPPTHPACTRTQDPNPRNKTQGITILQWNCLGAYSKLPTLMETGKLENIDVFMLQETLLLPKTPFKISGYKSFLLPRINGASRGCAILVRHHIACQELAAPPHCGDRVEVQGVIIQLHSTPLTLFNIYAPPQSTPELGELFTAASEEPTFIGGDFNGHHPHLESPSPPNTAGRHIAELLEEARGVALLNDTSQPTHIRGGRLDLSFISTPLRPVASWSVHPTITSDHFGVTTHLALDNLPQPQLPPPRYNIKRADWNAFTSALDRALQLHLPLPTWRC